MVARRALGAAIIVSLAACGQQAPPPPPTAQPAAYAVNRCGGAPANWQAQGEELRVPESGPYVIQTSAHDFQWNGQIISEKMLRDFLTEAGALGMPPPLSIVFAPDTPCTTVAMVRRAIDMRMPCGNGAACAEYSEAEWQKADASRPKVY